MADNKELIVKIKGLDELTPVMLKAMASMEASANKLAASVDKVNPPTDRLKEGSAGLNTGMVNLAAGMNILKTAVDAVRAVYGALSDQIGRSIDEALEAERAANRLTGALVSQGLYTQDTTDKLEKYIKTIEEQTGVSGEAIQQMIAMGVQMGLSVQKSQEMEEAARKLAAATGVDVMTAFNQLQGALNGQTRQLAKVIPSVKDFTEAQLKSGAAIDLVNQQLDAQYKLYQGSFEASLGRAKNAISNVYEAFGKIIIQNPLVIKGLNLFTDWMMKLETAIKATDKWITENSANIEKFANAAGKAIIVVGLVVLALNATAIAAAIAAGAMTALGAAVAFITGPIGLTVLAVGALTAAFYKWPGLFDQIIGGFKFLVGFFLQGLAGITGAAASLVGIFNDDLAESLNNVTKKIEEQADSLQLAGVQQVEYGTQANKTGDIAEAAVNKENKAIDENLKKQSDRNAKLKEVAESYDGITTATEKQIELMQGEAQERDKDLKLFQEYLDAKKRSAISAAEEQRMEVDKIQAEALKGSGGAEGANAGKQVELNNEQTKQAQLAVLRQQGVLNEQQYQEALLASQQRYANIKMEMAMAQQEALANALGNTDEAYQMKQDIEEQRFQLELQQMIERAELAGATEMEIQALKEQSEMEHLARMNDAKEQHFQQEAQMLESSGNQWAANGARIRAEQVKHGAFMGAIRGTQQTQEYRATQQFMTDLGSLRNSNSKKAFEVGKKAALVQATVNTFLAATSAYAALAGIPIVGPALGAIAAAAAIAAGFVNIQKINSQKFEGGQADEGMDSIPQSLAGKSFVLSQNERVVQPSANKDLTEFLNKEKMNGQTGGRGTQNISITLNYSGSGSPQDARAMAEIVVKEIRSMSERGTPIMSDKGIVKS